MPVKLSEFKSAVSMLDKHHEDLDEKTIQVYKDIICEYLHNNKNEWTDRKALKCQECLKK